MRSERRSTLVSAVLRRILPRVTTLGSGDRRMSGVDGLIGFLPGARHLRGYRLMVDLFSPPGQPANSGLIALIGIGLAFWAIYDCGAVARSYSAA